MMEGGDSRLTINGGYIAVDALGDGIDINGTVEDDRRDGACQRADGQQQQPRWITRGFKITGGFLVAASSAGMAATPDTTSTQYALAHTFSATQAAGTLVHIRTKDGQAVLSFAPTKTFQSIVISSPELTNGGNLRGLHRQSFHRFGRDSLYTGGTYTAGTQVASYTLTSVVTGATGGMAAALAGCAAAWRDASATVDGTRRHGGRGQNQIVRVVCVVCADRIMEFLPREPHMLQYKRVLATWLVAIIIVVTAAGCGAPSQSAATPATATAKTTITHPRAGTTPRTAKMPIRTTPWSSRRARSIKSPSPSRRRIGKRCRPT